jgi:hypothetical protein
MPHRVIQNLNTSKYVEPCPQLGCAHASPREEISILSSTSDQINLWQVKCTRLAGGN